MKVQILMIHLAYDLCLKLCLVLWSLVMKKLAKQVGRVVIREGLEQLVVRVLHNGAVLS